MVNGIRKIQSRKKVSDLRGLLSCSLHFCKAVFQVGYPFLFLKTREKFVERTAARVLAQIAQQFLDGMHPPFKTAPGIVTLQVRLFEHCSRTQQQPVQIEARLTQSFQKAPSGIVNTVFVLSQDANIDPQSLGHLDLVQPLVLAPLTEALGVGRDGFIRKFWHFFIIVNVQISHKISLIPLMEKRHD